MYLFEGLRLPTDKRALGLLGRIHTLWDENHWIETSTPPSNFIIYHWQEIPVEILNRLIELSTYCPNLLEEQLVDEPTIAQLIEWVANPEEPVDV